MRPLFSHQLSYGIGWFGFDGYGSTDIVYFYVLVVFVVPYVVGCDRGSGSGSGCGCGGGGGGRHLLRWWWSSKYMQYYHALNWYAAVLDPYSAY